MSSYLGASQAGTQMAVLAAGVSLSTTVTTPQAVCVPAQKCIPLYCVLRGNAVALDASATVSLGTTGALTSYISARALTSLPTTVAYVATCFAPNVTSFTPGANLATAGVTIYASLTQTSTAVSILADLIGYLVP